MKTAPINTGSQNCTEHVKSRRSWEAHNLSLHSRTFNTSAGNEVGEFGDGSPKVEVQSDGNAVKLAPDGYAARTHRYEKPGDYLVRVTRSNEYGVAAVGHLHVHVAADSD